MKLLYLVLTAVPSLAHYHAPAQKCHFEWQEVVTPHCTNTNEQVHLKILLKPEACSEIQGDFFNWPPPEFAKCWPVSN